MARINIEDSLLVDNRFAELMIKLGSRRCALGAITEAWILAQRYYLRTEFDRLIPLEEWKKQKIADEIIDVGLAEVREKGVHLCGADEQFKWLLQRSEAGKKPRGTPHQVTTPNREVNKEVMNNDRSTTDNGRATSLLLSPISKDINTNTYMLNSGREAPIGPSSPDQPKLKLVRHVFDFECLYREYPRKVGKSKGLKICQKEIKTPEEFELLRKAITNYIEYAKRAKVYFKHFNTFMGEWRDWLEADVGSKVAASGTESWSSFWDDNGEGNPNDTVGV